MDASTLDPKKRRRALEALSRARLAELTDLYELRVPDRRVIKNHINALVRSRRVDFAELLTHLKRDELKNMCVCLDLDEGGREKQRIITRILTLGREPAEDEPPDPASESQLVTWLSDLIDAHAQARPSVSLAKLVRERGRFQAHQRLRARAVADVARFLFANGFAIEPDYRGVKVSPGIDSVVQVTRIAERIADQEPEHGSSFEEYRVELEMALARADGHVADAEIKEMQKHAEERLGGLSVSERANLASALQRLRTSDVAIEPLAQALRARLSAADRRQLIEQLFDVAIADGVFLPQGRDPATSLAHASRHGYQSFRKTRPSVQGCSTSTAFSSRHQNSRPPPRIARQQITFPRNSLPLRGSIQKTMPQANLRLQSPNHSTRQMITFSISS